MFDDDFDLPDDLMAMADDAANALANMGEDYAAEACKDADKLVQFAETARRAENEQILQEAISNIFGIAHNFKGQGQTFGYDLLTQVGNVLCELTRPVNNPGRQDIPYAARLIGAIHVILHERLAGNGGDKGVAICADLGIRP